MLPRFAVDFNEMVEPGLVLLSQTGVPLDVKGFPVCLSKGMQIEIIEDDTDLDGTSGFLIAIGTAEPNSDGPEWARAATWCCRIDSDGVRRETQI
jgi:hypothetical protein